MEVNTQQPPDQRVDEETPLLSSTNDREGSSTEGETSPPVEQAHRSQKFLLYGNFASLGLWILGLMFLVDGFFLSSYGSWHFTCDENQDLPYLRVVIAMASIVVIPPAILNLVRLKKHGKPLPIFLNLLFLPTFGYLALWADMAMIWYLYFDNPRYCSPYGGDRPCHSWEATYRATNIMCIILLGCYGIAQISLLVLIIVNMVKDYQRSRHTSPGVARFTLPLGPFAFKIIFRRKLPRIHDSTQHEEATMD